MSEKDEQIATLRQRLADAETALKAQEVVIDGLNAKLWSARFAMSQANDALESDADLDKRREAFERIQREFNGVGQGEYEAAVEKYARTTEKEEDDDMTKMTKEQIARVCHEVNRAYCMALGDDSQPEWDNAPDWQKESAISGVEFHLTHHDAGPESSHESWRQQKERDGWIFGTQKDPERKEHPCMVPFDALPREQQAKDYIFAAIVRELKP